MVQLFRSLVCVSTALYVVFVVSYFWAAELFGTDVAAVLAHSGRGASVTFPEYTWLVLLGAWILVAVGLLLFVRWSREAFVALSVFSIFSTALGGIQINAGPQEALKEVIALADGAIVFMAYFSSVARRFRRAPNQ